MTKVTTLWQEECFCEIRHAVLSDNQVIEVTENQRPHYQKAFCLNL